MPADGDDAIGDDEGGEIVGAVTGDSFDGEGDGTEEDDGEGAGETVGEGTLVVGDFAAAGEADGLGLGDGEATGEFEGDAWGLVGEVAGGGEEPADLGAGEGALLFIDCDLTEYDADDTQSNNNSKEMKNFCLDIFLILQNFLVPRN